jgi:FkbM family methyltransferase
MRPSIALTIARDQVAVARNKWRYRRADELSHKRLVAGYRQFINTGDLVFDVGANVGDRTAAFRALGARVLAVEPQEDCVETLRSRFAGDDHVEVVGVALAAKPGTYGLRLNRTSTLATMSSEWLAATQETGRFAERSEWLDEAEVDARTLDALVAEHGVPQFCKVDVEGYEAEVFAGLSRPLRDVSFEFAYEAKGQTLRCAERLVDLGACEFNISLGESMQLARDWFTLHELRRRLDELGSPSAWGDVYARFAPSRSANSER